MIHEVISHTKTCGASIIRLGMDVQIDRSDQIPIIIKRIHGLFKEHTDCSKNTWAVQRTHGLFKELMGCSKNTRAIQLK